MGVVDLGEDGLDYLALSYLGEHEDLVGDRPGAVIGGAQQRTPMVTKRKDVFRRRGARARPETGARTTGGDDSDCAWAGHLTSSASSLARAVDSHGASMSVRPKWP